MPKARAYTAYFDTGGSESHPDVLVTAGAVSTSDKWARLDRKWLSVLETHGVSTLHMMELAHWKGEYSKWNRDETIRRAFLEDLSDVIAREVNKAFVYCLLLPDYRNVDSQYMLSEQIGGPYSLLQTVALIDVFSWALKRGQSKDRYGAIVELGDAGQDAFRKYFSSNESLMPTFHPKRLPSGEPVTPLSVCDWIAYEHRLLYSRALPQRRLPPQDKWRGSLRNLRNRVPFDSKIFETPFLLEFCRKLNVPPRVQKGAA